MATLRSQRVSRPGRRSWTPRPASRLVRRKNLLRHMLAAREESMRRRLHSFRENHALDTMGGMDEVERIQTDVSRDVEAGLIDREAATCTLIDEAIERVDRGADRICERCDQPIGQRRLRAVPFAHLCRDCQEAEERSAASPRCVPMISH